MHRQKEKEKRLLSPNSGPGRSQVYSTERSDYTCSTLGAHHERNRTPPTSDQVLWKLG